MGSAFSRKVQITRDEFLRQLPGAIGGLDHRTNENDILIGDGEKLIRIRLTELGVEELGSLELPMQQVDFSFENMASGEIDRFMTPWDERKLRIGG